MLSKRQRLAAWETMAVVSILFGGAIEILGEVYFPGSWFHRIATFVFASGATLGVVGMFLAFASLAISDWNENKSATAFVNLGHGNDRIISVHTLREAVLHVPVAGTVHQAIVAPSNSEIPYVAGETLEHIHFGNQIPKIEVMDDEVYQRLFGPRKNEEI